MIKKLLKVVILGVAAIALTQQVQVSVASQLEAQKLKGVSDLNADLKGSITDALNYMNQGGDKATAKTVLDEAFSKHLKDTNVDAKVLEGWLDQLNTLQKKPKKAGEGTTESGNDSPFI